MSRSFRNEGAISVRVVSVDGASQYTRRLCPEDALAFLALPRYEFAGRIRYHDIFHSLLTWSVYQVFYLCFALKTWMFALHHAIQTALAYNLYLNLT